MRLAILVLVGCSHREDGAPIPLATVEETPEPVVPPPTGGDPGIARDVLVGGTRMMCEGWPEQARDVIGVRCGACHSAGAASAEALVASGWVVPYDPGASLMFAEVTGDAMPTDSGGGALTASEKHALEQWIICGADPWLDGATRGFLSPEMEIQAVRGDVVALSFQEQATSRYLSLVPLYDAGVPSDRIALYATGLAKLAFSLNASSNPPVLDPVDIDGTELPDGSVITVADDLGQSLIFRLDLGDLGWDRSPVEVWEELVRTYPYAVPLGDSLDAAEDVQYLTGTRVPIVRGDWFTAEASLPPLYYDLLNVPDTLDAFFLQFGGFDRNDDLASNDAACAGIDAMASVVSGFNRAFCRYDSREGFCWESFDFGSNVGPQDLFANPTGFLEASDGGEAFCSLDDGMVAWFVHDADGHRLDAAPSNLISDPGGAQITAGRSCIGCHDIGVQPLADQILATVLGMPANYSDEVIDQVMDWYPNAGDLASIIASDQGSFAVGLDALNVPLVEEPVTAAAADFEADLDLARIAAELGVPAARVADLITAEPEIEGPYLPALVGGTLPRDIFETIVRDTICTLQLGDACDEAAFCGESAVPCIDGTACDSLGQCASQP